MSSPTLPRTDRSPAGDQRASGKPRPAGRRRRRPRYFVWTWRVVVLVVWLGLWELVARTGIVDDLFTSKPSAIARSFYEGVIAGTYWRDSGITLYETLAGFVIASAIGIVFGVIASQIPMIDTVIRPLLTGANNVPRIALAPLFVLWFGLGSTSRIVLVISVVFFVVLFNTLAALSSVERDFVLLARSLGASKVAVFWRYRLPGAVPTIFAGLQLGLTYAFLAAVTGEMLTGTGGLGAQLTFAIGLYRTDQFFALLLLLVILAVGVSSAVQWLEGRLLRWRAAEVRGVA